MFDVPAADFNADGHPDVAVTFLDHAPASIVLNVVSVLLGDGAGGLGAPTSFAAGALPRQMATGDFNEDGRLDVATANLFERGVSLLLGDGQGRLPVASPQFYPQDAQSLVTGDFNEDGNSDVATANRPISVYLGDGTGGLGPRQDFNPGDEAWSLAVGDFNGDGHLDIASGNQAYAYIDFPPPPSVSIMLGDGHGGFTPHFLMKGQPLAVRLVAADFNEDGKLDIAGVNRGGGITVYLGDGAGNLLPGTTYFSSYGFASLVAADVDGDGHLDLATVELAPQGSAAILRGDGRGHFAFLSETYLYSSPQEVTLGDVNNDGNLDMAVATGSGVAVLLGDGRGGFRFAAGPGTFYDGLSAVHVRAADFDHDGNLDLAIGHANSRTLTLLRGNGVGGFFFPPPLDFEVEATNDLAVDDFDGNGSADLVAAGLDGSVSVLVNRTQNSILTLQGDRLFWTAVGTVTNYDVVRGGLQALHGSGGNFTFATDACLTNDLPFLSADDPSAPPLGDGFWYLVRADVQVGKATYDSIGPSQSGPRDAQINASSLACP